MKSLDFKLILAKASKIGLLAKNNTKSIKSLSYKNTLGGLLRWYFRAFLLAMLLAYTSYASNLKDLKSISANFSQEIQGEKGAMPVIYKGVLKAKATKSSQLAKWDYTIPLKKVIYVENKQAMIYEPSLNQVSIGSVDSSISFLSVLKEAKVLDKTHLQSVIQDTTYDLTLKDGKPYLLTYIDTLGNKVRILFSNVVLNAKIDNGELKALIPPDADVIELN